MVTNLLYKNTSRNLVDLKCACDIKNIMFYAWSSEICGLKDI
jgi:hypothetical protein